MNDLEAEYIAKALYGTVEKARGWAREPELLKQGFRRSARVAIAAIEHMRSATPSTELDRAANDRVPFGAPTFRAILRGPRHVYARTNAVHRRGLGDRDVIGRPVREAFPELEGQGFFELLDHVYETGQPFIGRFLPIWIQAKPGAPLEEHFIDLICRPIASESHGTVGILVEGHDVTGCVRLARRILSSI